MLKEHCHAEVIGSYLEEAFCRRSVGCPLAAVRGHYANHTPRAGDHHKKQRKLLNPVFSINHMRNLTPIFYEITHEVRVYRRTSVESHLTMTMPV